MGKKGSIPDYLTPGIKKELNDLGLDGIEDLDELEEKNLKGFSDVGLIPSEKTGTFKSPILVPSMMDSRVVGYQDPSTHAMSWFTIFNDNNTYYIKALGLFFKMLHIKNIEVETEHQ